MPPESAEPTEEQKRLLFEQLLADFPQPPPLTDSHIAELQRLLALADLTEEQDATLDAPMALAIIPALTGALRAQNAVLEDLEAIARGDLKADEYPAEQALEDLQAATANTAARISAADAQALRDVRARTAALSRRRSSLAAWQRSLVSQMPQSPGARLLYLLALAGDEQAQQELAAVTRARAAHPSWGAQDLLAVQILALLEALDALGADAEELRHQIAVLLAAVVLAPALYHCRRHTQPRDLLRGSVELNAPPSLRACSTLRGMATVVGDPRTSP